MNEKGEKHKEEVNDDIVALAMQQLGAKIILTEESSRMKIAEKQGIKTLSVAEAIK